VKGLKNLAISHDEDSMNILKKKESLSCAKGNCLVFGDGTYRIFKAGKAEIF
jgi:hypothetical protein